MSIYIQNAQGQFVLATDLDLQNRGYTSTQELGSVPTLDNFEVKLTVSAFTDDKKVKIIKVIRNVCNAYYGKETFRDRSTTFKVAPLRQESKEYDDCSVFGLKHMKHFVEGSCSLTIHTGCYNQIILRLQTESSNLGTPLECTFEEKYLKGSNNLERLQDHRALLKEELRKIDDLIAYQLYS